MSSLRRLVPDIALFLLGGLLVLGVVRVDVPRVAAHGIDPFVGWMILSVPFVFGPLTGLGWLLLRSERARRPFSGRLRMQRLTRRDWIWTCGGFFTIALGSAAMSGVCRVFHLDIDPFNREPHAWTHWWVLGVWTVYWPFNILGEELVWRGIVLPRMEVILGSRAWLLNSALWAMFHVGFGPGNILVVSPTLLVVPLLSQRCQSTWAAVLLHAALSLPGMIGIALGYV